MATELICGAVPDEDEPKGIDEKTNKMNRKLDWIMKKIDKGGEDEKYKEGYTEAISDLYRGLYENWIEDEEGDYKDMAEKIIDRIKGERRIRYGIFHRNGNLRGLFWKDRDKAEKFVRNNPEMKNCQVKKVEIRRLE